MKKQYILIALIITLLVTPALALASSEQPKETDYMAMMVAAIVNSDMDAGLSAELLRNDKIDTLELPYVKIGYVDLYYLSKIIYAEAGSRWLPDAWKLCVGEVVLNRVASPEFPNTIKEVVEQPGQYYGKNSRYFAELLPDERCVLLARDLLEGKRLFGDPSVVFQANFKQGSGVHTAAYDKLLGYTYFCFSNHPELYKGGEN